MAASARSSFRERYRHTFNKRPEHGWCIIFGYPIGRLLVLLIAPVGWIRPNALTLLGFGCKMSAAAGLLSARSTAGLAASLALLQAGSILDCMDGTLARLRGTSSEIGALADKVGDIVALFVLGAVVGVRACRESGEPLWIAVGCAGGFAHLLRVYTFWVMRFLTHERVDEAALTGLAPIPAWGEIGREWLRGWPHMLRFRESDQYFFVAVFVLAADFRWAAAVFSGTLVFGCCWRLGEHFLALRRRRGA